MRQKGLAPKTIRNYLTTLRSILEAAADEYSWEQRDPFRNIEEFIPEELPAKTQNGFEPPDQVWRYDELMLVFSHMDKRQLLVTTFMVLTGLISSEVAGIRKKDIRGDYLLVRNFSTRKEKNKKQGKRKSRTRKIKITKAIRRCLDEAISSSADEYLFKTVTGLPFAEGTYRKNYWIPALKSAGLDYRRPYSLRHTFAGWSLLVGVEPPRLVAQMGHSSKKMVYEEYAEWTYGLEEDKEKILEFFGHDYIS